MDDSANKSSDSPPQSPSDTGKDFQLVIGEQSNSSSGLEILDESSTDEAVFSDEDDDDKQAPPPPPPPPPIQGSDKKEKVRFINIDGHYYLSHGS